MYLAKAHLNNFQEDSAEGELIPYQDATTGNLTEIANSLHLQSVRVLHRTAEKLGVYMLVF